MGAAALSLNVSLSPTAIGQPQQSQSPGDRGVRSNPNSFQQALPDPRAQQGRGAPATRGEVRAGPALYRVASRRIGSQVVLGGTVIPYKEVKVAAQVPGQVTYVAGEEGDRFDRNELLVATDDSELMARRQQAVAQLNNALTALRNARVQYNREIIAPRSQNPTRMPGMGMPGLWDQMFTRPFGDMTGLSNPDVTRSANLYSAGTKVGQAQSQVAQARASIQQIDAKIRDTRANAPFEGVITDKVVEVGDTVQPGQPLLRYADTHYLRLKVNVPVRLVSGLEEGMQLPVRLDLGNTRVQGKVAQIYPIAESEKHTVTVKLDLPQDTPGGPGMYATVLIPDTSAPAKELPVVPHSAVRWNGSLPSVFVVDSKGRARLRMVRLGEATGRGTIAVLSGLRSGETVLADPSPQVHSGWRVPGRAPGGRGQRGSH
jgi:RND family efflux transporter MFP subunit